jgi:hypothetical protein
MLFGDSGYRRRRIRVWVICLLLGLVAVVAVIFVVAERAWKPVEQVLSDGTILRIEAVTYGTNHVFSRHPIREKVRDALPKRFQSWLGKGVLSSRTQTAPDCLVLWTTRFDPVSGTYVRPASEWMYAVDEHGCRFRSNFRQGATMAGNVAVWGVVFDTYPRTAKHFHFMVCDRADNVVGKIKLPNFFQAKAQSWVPEKVPITKTNRQLAAELRRFRLVDAPTRAFFDVRLLRLQDIEPWVKGPEWICDSSGNRTLLGALCTNEAAWKIEANFFRNARAQFRADETWVITNVAIPKPGEIIALNKTKTVQGLLVAVGSLQGGRPIGTPPDPLTLFVAATHWNDEFRILVRARDHTGRKLVAHAHEERAVGSHRHATQRNRNFNIHPMPDSKYMDIEILVQQPVKLEFFVDPSQSAVGAIDGSIF